MKTILYAALGLMTGALVTGALTTFTTGCGDCPTYDKIPAGTFVPNSDKGSPEADYKLVVGSDFKQVTETFTRGGKSYTIVYAIKSIEGI